MDDKIQTGLRIPAARCQELQKIAEEMGVSLNALLLVLIDLGMMLRNGEFTLLPRS